MGYYADLDDDRGMDAEIDEVERERDFYAEQKRKSEQSRIDAAVRMALAAHGIIQSVPTPPAKKKRQSGLVGQLVEVKCKRCRNKFQARVADRKRGWGKFCSKSCKASFQLNGYVCKESS